MAEIADIVDTVSYRFQTAAEKALTSALAIQNVAGLLCQVDEFGNVTPLLGGVVGGITNLSGDVVANGPGSVNSTIQAKAVTYAKIQDVANAVLLGNNSGGAGSMQELSASTVRSMLSLASIATSGSAGDLTTGTLAAARFGALSGDVTTPSGSYATTIANNVVTLAKFQQIATNSLLGRSTAATGNVEVITVGSGLSLSGGTLTATGTGGITQLTGDVTAGPGSGSQAATIAANAVTTTKINANAVTLAKMATQADQTFLGNVSGGAAVPSALTKAQMLTALAGSLATGIVGVTTTTGALNSSALTNKDVLYATGANTVGQNANFQFDSATTTLSVPTVTVSTAVQGGAGNVLALNNGAAPTTSIGLTSSSILVTGNVSLTGNLAPATDDTYALGASGKAWAALWVDTIARTSVPGTITMVPSQGVQIDSNTTGNVLITHGSTGGRWISDATGIAFFPVVGGTPTGVAQQTGGAATAGGTYTATEQGMLNRIYTALRAYGLLT